MNDTELIQWLAENSSGVYRPCRDAAGRIEYFRSILQQFAECDLNDDNCASLEVASKRIRNLARRALADGR